MNSCGPWHQTTTAISVRIVWERDGDSVQAERLTSFGAWNGPCQVLASFERIGLSHVRTVLGD